MGRGPQIAMEERARIVAAMRAGEDDVRLARRFGRSRSTINTVRRQVFGVTGKGRRRAEKPAGKNGAIKAAPPPAEAPAPKPHAITARPSPAPWTKPEPKPESTIEITVPVPTGVLQRILHARQDGEGVAACAARLLAHAVTKIGRAA